MQFQGLCVWAQIFNQILFEKIAKIIIHPQQLLWIVSFIILDYLNMQKFQILLNYNFFSLSWFSSYRKKSGLLGTCL